MLGIRIHYLSGACYAAASHNRDEPEWPPHPARLFSALMAACFATGLGEVGLAALRWLERQGAPQLAASRASLRQQGLTFVPINDPENTAQKKLSTEAYHAHRWLARLPACRDRQPRRFPCATPADPNVWMIWPTAQPDDATRQALDAMPPASAIWATPGRWLPSPWMMPPRRRPSCPPMRGSTGCGLSPLAGSRN